MKIRLQTSAGDIELELEPDKAPVTCENFVQYVNDGHYDNTIFHRVIQGFMIQGGGFDPEMSQKQCRPTIENEADNGLANNTGTIAMARLPDPHSASSQFFINVNDNAFLNHSDKSQSGWGYCVFGKVTSGLDAIMEISMTPTGNRGGRRNVPMENVTILNASVVDE